jgi:cell division protein FtsB
MNLSPDASKELIELLQHRIEALSSRNEFLEAENEVLKRTLINELQNG